MRGSRLRAVPGSAAWLGLGGSLRIIHRYEHLPLDQGAQSPIQTDLERFQAGQFTVLPANNVFLISNLSLPSSSVNELPLVLSLHATVISPCPLCYRLSGTGMERSGQPRAFPLLCAAFPFTEPLLPGRSPSPGRAGPPGATATHGGFVLGSAAGPSRPRQCGRGTARGHRPPAGGGKTAQQERLSRETPGG